MRTGRRFRGARGAAAAGVTAAGPYPRGPVGARHGQRIDDPDGGLTHLFRCRGLDGGLACPTAQATLRECSDALAEVVDLSAGADTKMTGPVGVGPGIGSCEPSEKGMLDICAPLGDPDAFRRIWGAEGRRRTRPDRANRRDERHPGDGPRGGVIRSAVMWATG